MQHRCTRWREDWLIVSFELERPFEGVLPSSIAGAAIGFTFGGPVGAASGALVPIMERLVRLSQKELSAQDSRSVAMWAIAARTAERSADELLDAAQGNEHLTQLGYTAAEAAERSRYPARIVALGRVLAAGIGATDDAELDHWQLMIDALAEVDRPHLVVLSRFANIEGNDQSPVFARRTLSWVDVKALNPEYGRSISSLLARLERLGLLHAETVATLAGDEGPGDEERVGAYWRLSDFGCKVLDELWRAGGSAVIESPSSDQAESQ